MDVAVLFSGGKDGCFALWYALHQGWNVKLLITVQSNNPESYMFHYPNVRWTEVQARALKMPIKFIESTGLKEKEVEDLYIGMRRTLEEVSVDGLVSGAISSDYQKSRLDTLCDRLGVASFAPLWRKDPYSILREEVDLGFKMVVTACMAMGLTREWLGAAIDPRSLEKLRVLSEKHGFNPAFEGGEGETFVLDGPIFHEEIKILKHRIIWDGSSGRYVIEEAQAAPKFSV